MFYSLKPLPSTLVSACIHQVVSSGHANPADLRLKFEPVATLTDFQVPHQPSRFYTKRELNGNFLAMKFTTHMFFTSKIKESV